MANILYIDDSSYMRELVSESLDLDDHKVTLAIDGLDGLQKYKDNSSFDLIITDINMPKMDGITFIKELRKTNQQIPILILTTESSDGLKKEAFQYGANGWIIKPFQHEQLMNAIFEILN